MKKALNLTIIQKILLNKVLLVVIHQNFKIVLTFWIFLPFYLFSMLLIIQGYYFICQYLYRKRKYHYNFGSSKKTNKKIFCSKFSKKLQKWWKKTVYEQCLSDRKLMNFNPIFTLVSLPSKFQVCFEVFE